ncbi:hypothetical protein D3C72_2022650 [compost metagenome]
MSNENNEDKSLEDKKAELEAQLKEIKSKLNEENNENEDEEVGSEDLWLKTVKKIIIGLWGIIILIIVGIIGLYTYSNYLDKVIEEKENKKDYSNAQNVVDLNTIVTTPGFEDNNEIDNIPTLPDNSENIVNE